METSLLFARVARRTVTKQHRRFKKEQKKRIEEKKREREQGEKKRKVIDGTQPKNSDDTDRSKIRSR